MKYTVDIVIDRSRDDVVTNFNDPEKLKEWMDGLEEFEHLEGTPGEVGAKSRLFFKIGKREINMIETITEKALPDRFSSDYEADGVFNKNEITFESVGADQTRMTINTDFQFKSLPMKIMAFLMPSMFKKQTRKNLKDFKTYAERQ